MPRKKISKRDEAEVLLKSRRRCAFCFGLGEDATIKKGQIAHIDRDSSNSAFNNLAYLCMEHHDQYDSRTSQSKGLTQEELRSYRDELYAVLEAENPVAGTKKSIDVRPAGTSDSRQENHRNPVLLRMKADAEQMSQLEQNTDEIEIIELSGSPPSSYLVSYRLKGVVALSTEGLPRFATDHLVEISLRDGYPMNIPPTRFLTPIFHPNISREGNVCIGWFDLPCWISDICVHVARMIDYQIFHPNAAANTRASEWAIANEKTFPLTGWNLPSPTIHSISSVPGPTGHSGKADKKIQLVHSRAELVRLKISESRRGMVHEIEAPVGLRLSDLVEELVIGFEIPRVSVGGDPVPYRLVNKANGSMLSPDSTIQESKIGDGDELQMVAQVTAG